ncbi:MAG: hypothetical protein IPK82_37355 [Polyangiaceae bacterium]|nr:hypothetical protein [Polyangiaceae bacterium]
MIRTGVAFRVRAAVWHLWTVGWIATCAAMFYMPAYSKAGMWPAPLDDVYIHFDFARSIAQGHPFEWIAGNGYSSGATSLSYPFVLAMGYLVGFRGAWLGLFAAGVACLCLWDLCRSTRSIMGRSAGLAAFVIAPVWVGIPLLDWSWFSGMEVALLGACVGRLLRALRKAELSTPADRPKAQWRVGLWAAALVAARPETAVLVGAVAVAAAFAAGSVSAISTLARVGAPPALLMCTQALASRVYTGEWSAAGAVRKLVLSDPYLTPLDKALVVIKNLIALRTTAFDAALGGSPWSLMIWILGLAAILSSRYRRPAAALWVGSLGAMGLVALNTTAQYQNWRYAMPSLVMAVLAAFVGAAAIADWVDRKRVSIGKLVAPIALTIIAIAPVRHFSRQIDHFARASANIAEQQVEVGKRLALMQPAPRRVFLSDAGAIPYFSNLPALDGLGLGGFHDLPFARASVHGIPAVVELMERLPLEDRPDVMAIYPSWWKGVADVFGTPIDAVRITDNVICGAEEKVIYRADFSALAAPREQPEGVVFELDVADLVSEKNGRYEPAFPQGGWVVQNVLPRVDGTLRFDGGRILPQGREEAFTLPAALPISAFHLVVRTDGGPEQVLIVSVWRLGRELSSWTLTLPVRPMDRWSSAKVELPELSGGEMVKIRSEMGAFRNFHVWLVRSDVVKTKGFGL